MIQEMRGTRPILSDNLTGIKRFVYVRFMIAGLWVGGLGLWVVENEKLQPIIGWKCG